MYKLLSLNVTEVDYNFAKHLFTQSNTNASDFIRQALVKLANRYVPNVKDWDDFQLAAIAVNEREEKNLLKEELEKLKIENQTLRALMPSPDNVKEKEMPKFTEVIPEEDIETNFKPMREVAQVG